MKITNLVGIGMDYIRLGKGGPVDSAIGIGTRQAADVSCGKGATERNSINASRRSYECEVNFFDTAELYREGLSEEIVGKAIRNLDRDEVVVATKVSSKHLRYQDVIEACEGSLKRLGLKEIDVYQVH
jgi:aryl-alcohol dehydrogenase-like predicted oxidoreductase